MRVAFLSRSARAGDAIGNQVAEKLSLFVERGADVRVFLEETEGVHPAVGPHAEKLAALPHGAGWEFLHSADLVCVEFGQYYDRLALLPLLADGKRRIVIDYHGITPPDLWVPHQREMLEKGLAYRGLAWCADLILVHSRHVERELIEATAIPPERVVRIGLPVDPHQFCPGGKTEGFRKALGLDGTTLLLFVGRLAANKRVPLLVELLPRLADISPPVHLLVVGDNSDLYQIEADRCRKRARELGVEERLHFLGQLTGEPLRRVYQAADVFVIPSAWESFSVPVIEAMASGLPVVASRAFALPETVGDAGLTFAPDDVDDCARQVRKVLSRRKHGEPGSSIAAAGVSGRHKHIAVVSFRFGTDFAGGAEWSLRRIMLALARMGHQVEVFSTCTNAENKWRNQLPAGTTLDGRVPVHRFPIDRHDRARHLRSYQAIVQANGRVAAALEQEYLAHSIHSAALLDLLSRRAHEFDAVIVGPYLFGLTCDVARLLPSKTLVLPCFHDEPLARLAVWKAVYGEGAGLLYHSPEEQEFAQAELGLNHPYAGVIGTWLEVDEPGAARPARPEGAPGRYLAYCGRYSEQKELPRLLDFAHRYHELHPERFTFVFMGQGEVAIPRQSWARDLGFISEEQKKRWLANADALVHLSRKESLSLAALEAWSLATPVIADAHCPVLAAHLSRCGAGATIDDFDGFVQTLDDLWENAHAWRKRGDSGQAYVRDRYGSFDDYRAGLDRALADMDRPLPEQMRQMGLERARQFHRPAWRRRLAQLVDNLLHGPGVDQRDDLALQPHRSLHRVPVGRNSVLISVRVMNRGTRLAVPDGPGRTLLCSRVFDRDKRRWVGPRVQTCISLVLLPGQTRPAAVPVSLPPASGDYEILLWAERALEPREDHPTAAPVSSCTVRLHVEEKTGPNAPECCASFLESAQMALAEVHRLQRLPDDYVDVTEGWFARAKRWLKRKLLNNFKLAYVDVLSRQQTQVNQRQAEALRELMEWCGTLDHAVRALQEQVARLESQQIGDEPAPAEAEFSSPVQGQ